MLLKPLPFPEPDRLVRIFNKYPGAGVDAGGSNGVPDYFDRQRDMPALEEIAHVPRRPASRISGSGLGEAERIQAMTVTPSFFRVLRAQPHRGQLFTEAQGELGQEKVVILTLRLLAAACSAAATTRSARTCGSAASRTRSSA